MNTIIRTVLGTLLSVVLYISGAYPCRKIFAQPEVLDGYDGVYHVL